MNLFYTINDAFVPQLGTAICSVCENNKEADTIHFYIGALNVTDEHQQALKMLTDRYNREITFIPIDHLQDRMGFEFDTHAWNEVIISRLLADKLLPQQVERVLYLDGDTIVLDSLKELWETDLQEKAIGACIEPTVNRQRKKDIGLEDLPYYNSGVLLIDLKTWRKEKTGERILRFYQSRGGLLYAPDQDAINGALPGEIYTLPPRYNFFNVLWYYPYKTLIF